MPRIEVDSMPGVTGRSLTRALAPLPSIEAATALALASLLLLLTGCHHQRHQPYAPPPPTLHSESSYQRRIQPNPTEADRAPIPRPEGRPEFVETGMASWYGPSGRRAADGSAYDGTGMTAAHKTLPLGTVVRVTNLSNNESVMVRITDRGPFSHGRILDLSENAAKEIGLYRMGVAEVRVEAFGQKTASVQAKWCVQTGAFKNQQDALDLKSALARRYTGSRVIEFASSTGYWVRIDPIRHDRTEAVAIMDWIGKPFPEVVPYLVRLN
ncbi:MAG: septal ring lytic transglycosylase RlpA family protein [Acidobacteriaceae bacterium]